MLTFGSLFTGIGGFDKGFHDAGMRCAWQVEIDAAARGVLARHWPDVPRHSDIRDCGTQNLAPVDVICGGFPCQDLSVAGRRSGLAGARSGLFYEMTRIVDELRPMLLVWENVPGLLSSDSGRDFGRVLVELERIGYSGCWTTLDAQFFGLAQRRQRVFGVFARGDIGAAVCAEILSLAARLPWNTEKGRAKGARVAAAVAASAGHHGRSSPRGDGSDNLIADQPYTIDWMAGSSGDTSFRGKSRAWITDKPGRSRALTANRTLAVFGGNDTRGERAVSSALTSHGSGRYDFESETFVAATLNSGGNNGGFRTEPGEHIVFESRYARNGRGAPDTIVPPLKAESGQTGKGDGAPLTAPAFGVRRLTPLECERLQGFPDDWTAGQPDSARYRQLGNAVAVPVARWIGQRIVTVLT